MNTTFLILDPGKRAYIPPGMEQMIQVVHFDKVNLVLSNKSLQTLAMRAGYVLKNKPGSRYVRKKTPPQDHMYGSTIAHTTPFHVTKRPR